MSARENFWHWFKNNEYRIFKECESTEIWNEIDVNLSLVDKKLGWELGPINSEKLYFAISPELNDEVLPMASELLNLAYISSLWDFRLGRQRRPWSSIVAIVNDESHGHAFKDIDISNWRHIVFKVPETDLVDIIFECGEDFILTGDDLDELAAMVATNLIGEITVMERVDSIEVTDRFEARFETKAKPAAWLPYAFGMKPV